MPSTGYLSSLFTPKNVAVVGASAAPHKIGHLVVNNLVSAGFTGGIFPINPAGGRICGLDALHSVADIPAAALPLDLAVICLPAQKVPAALEELAALPTRAVTIISAGFKETGGAGVLLEEEVKSLAKRHNMALLGPNCMGLVNTRANLNSTFAEGKVNMGNMGFFSQSGALCVAIFDWAREQNIGFSVFVSLGNKAIVDESDLLLYLADDPDTKVILGYLESVESGQRFLQNAHTATRKKPVVLLRAGRTAAGARAASSHTGALAGADMAYEAAFRQTGIIRAARMEDLFNLAQAFASQPLPKGDGVAVVTNSGGPGIVAADACETAGLRLAGLSQATVETLKEMLPSYAALYNPVDVIGDATAETISQAVDVVLRDQAVFSLLALVAPTARTPVEDVARQLLAVIARHDKPVFCCFMGGHGVAEGRGIMLEAGVPCYQFPEPAIDAIQAMHKHSAWRKKPMPVEVAYRRDLHSAEQIIVKARQENQLELVEYQVQGLLKAYEMPMLESKLARTSDEAVQIAKQIGYPVALKIASPQISHKTDVMGVTLDLATPEAVRAAFIDITARAARMRKDAYIAGCLVQAMSPKGAREVIVGFKRDLRFGPLVLFGLGGIHVEAFKDISCRLAPLSLDDVHDMIREIKAFPILAGMRGQKAVKFTALEDILLIMSHLALDFPEIQEAECNPVLAWENGALVADMRVILSPPQRVVPDATA